MEKLPGISQVRERIYTWPEDNVRHALMYQLMICGRPAEVTGKYKPDPSSITLVEIDDEEAVLFPVKTAKRKGKLRPVALPIKYEPWAEELYHTLTKSKMVPFPSGRTVLRRTHEIFDGMSYPIEEYTHKSGTLIESHWREARRHFLRHTRAMDLMINYEFDGLDIAIYGGWSSKSADQQLPTITQRYLHLMANEVNLGVLKMMASRYFPKLCKETKK